MLAINEASAKDFAVAEDSELRKLVADVAAAYFSNSHVSPTEIPSVISQIANSLAAVGAPAVECGGGARSSKTHARPDP